MSALRSSSFWLAVLCVIAVIVACADQAPPRFPHAVHLAGMKCGGRGMPECLSCNVCHQVAKGRDHAFPDKQLCDRCHKPNDSAVTRVQRPPRNVPPPVAYTIAFDHKKHLAMKEVKGQCIPCHAGAPEPDAPLFPPMARCFECHEHKAQWDRAECSPCHVQKDLGRLLPQSYVKHDAAFQRGHGLAARQQRKLCQQCHTEQHCNDCHDVSQGLSIEKRRPEAIDKNLVHRGDFISRHAIEAKSQPARCARCHTPSTCDSCHLERGVSGGALNGRNPHPPGWVSGAQGEPSGHGRNARRDILACAGCHDQGPATNCIRCHKVGAYGGNPHPKGWKSARSDSAAMCRYCHE
ncbi:MAG: hypothetical protein IPI67_27790 [Myxococcales bacterium]|nr:hypothetical protein [Myxococcales bacterium]